MPALWRLFVAIELPHEVLRAIGRLQADIQRAVPDRTASWVRPEGIHLTLKFLGDAPVTQVDALAAALANAAAEHHCFKLSLEGVGCFPSTYRPRVLWIGVGGDLRQLSALQASVEKHISPLGYPPEDRSFSPHLTLARARRGARPEEVAALGRAADTHSLKQAVAWQVDAISLIRSRLDPGGAIYTQVGRAKLVP